MADPTAGFHTDNLKLRPAPATCKCPPEVCCCHSQTTEAAAPVDWKAIADNRERELRREGEGRHAAEQQRAQFADILQATAQALDMLPGDRIDSMPAVARRLRAKLDAIRQTAEPYREVGNLGALARASRTPRQILAILDDDQAAGRG